MYLNLGANKHWKKSTNGSNRNFRSSIETCRRLREGMAVRRKSIRTKQNKSTPMESLDEDGFLQRVYHYRAPQVMLHNNVESSSFATVVLPKGNFYSFRNQLQNDAADCLWYDCEHYSTISVL